MRFKWDSALFLEAIRSYNPSDIVHKSCVMPSFRIAHVFYQKPSHAVRNEDNRPIFLEKPQHGIVSRPHGVDFTVSVLNL